MNRVITDMRKGYREICNDIMVHGAKVAPRGMVTREVLGYSFTFKDPLDALPIGTGRGLSLPFAAVEAAQLQAGVSFPDMMKRINPTMSQFMDTDDNGNEYLHGAYGPRIAPTLMEVVTLLKKSPDTRQAVLTIFETERDITPNTPDVPCTLSLQFFIRNDALDLSVTMRSNDVWWGLAYDVFQFTQLQAMVAQMVGVRIGVYRHMANSMHAYERDWDSVRRLKTGQPLAHYPIGFRSPWSAISVLSAARNGKSTGSNLTEQWYSEHLTYVSPRATDSSSEENPGSSRVIAGEENKNTVEDE